jgi:hypothetical protein
MIKFLLFLTICCFISFLLGSVTPPNPPTWPSEFSTGVDVISQGAASVGRWFWSETLKAERMNLEEHGNVHQFMITHYDQGKRYVIYVHHGQRPTCHVMNVPKQMHVYDFTRFNYTGRKVYREMWVDEWQQTQNRTLITYIDRVGTEEPVMFSLHIEGHQPEVTHFWEFDQGPQSPWMFNVSYEFPGVCKTDSSKKEAESSEQPRPLLDPQICQKAASIAHQKATCHCPYKWGGTHCGCNGNGGFDCSGLTYYAYRTAGWTGIARTAQGQAQQGGSCGSCSPSNTAACKPGDLFFFAFSEMLFPEASLRDIDHVVMYIGGNQIAECPHSGVDCRVTHPYTPHYVTCRRYC